MNEAAWRRRFRAPRVTLPMWARENPDRLLYSSNLTGKWELYAWDRAADKHRQVTDRPEGTVSGRVDPRGEAIWWFDDERGNEFGRWMIEAFSGGDARLASRELPAAYGAGLALARSFAVVGSSTQDGTFVHLLRAGEDQPRVLYSHKEEATVVGVSRNDTLVGLSHSEHGDSRHPALRVLRVDGSTVGNLWDGPGRGLWPSGWSRVPGDSRLLVRHERRDLPRPLVWAVETDEVLDPEVDLPGEVHASWYPDGSALLLSHNHRGRVQLFRLPLPTGDLEPLDHEPGTISRATVRPDGEVWYDWSSSSSPPEIRADSRLLLRPSGPGAPPGIPYSDAQVGGVHVFLAEPARSRPHPAIFLLHGGPEWHDSDSFSPLVQAWADHGYVVVLVNYRGSTGYGRAWRDALQGNPGFTELADVANVHDWVVSAGIADPQRVILAGASWGGYLTLLGLGVQPDRWSLGIAAVPVADYLAAYEDEMEPLKAFDRSMFGGSPDEHPDLYRDRSPITYVEKVRVPVMILAGENDSRCPIRQIENYISRLVQLRKPHEVYRFDAGHGSLVIDETIRQVEAEIGFAARHLRTDPPAA